MSIRNLEFLLRPRSVALIGASDRPASLGAVVMRNLLAAGFEGPLWPVNHRHAHVGDLKAWPDVRALPGVPDLAIICTPAATVPDLIGELGRKGTRAAIVMSAGLKQPSAPGGPSLEQAMLDAARPHLLRILGPNCIGALVPGVALNASFAPGHPQPGPLAFITQSGALATAMLDWANGQGIGFTHFISLGDSADVDFGDLLDYLGSDAATRAILMYAESVQHARKFMSAARAASRNKPVIVIKAGRAPEGARAAASHTGALAGSDAVFDAAVGRAGMLRVDTLEALFDAAQTLAHPQPWRGERLALLTNGGGAGVLAADALALAGGTAATLSQPTIAALDACLPPGWSHGNPVDIVGDAPTARYTQAFSVLLAAPEVDAVLFMHAPTAIVPALDIAQACLPLLQESRKPVLASWLGGPAVAAARRLFMRHGMACYDTPERAVDGWMQLSHWHRNQQALLQLPLPRLPGKEPDRHAAQRILTQALEAGRQWLDESQAKQVLQAYDIPVVRTVTAADADAAVAAATHMGFPVALKIISPQIVHKTDVGGVALDLLSADQVRLAADRMLQRICQAQPEAVIEGFTVQQMASSAGALEFIVGIASDPVFGPVVLFGAGGTAVEVLPDRSVALPPLNEALARELISRTRVSALMAPHRGKPGIDMNGVVDVLLKVAQMAADLPALAELDINPLLGGPQGAVALDARIRLRQPAPGEASRLALRPYPQALEELVRIGASALLLRPIQPQDGERLSAFYSGASTADLRLRFFMTRREVPRSELARYCQIDYEREMTFIALDGDTMVGEVRAVSDPDNREAEFAIQVSPAWQGRGLGRTLLDKLVRYLRERGTAGVVGNCLQENSAMLSLAHRTGFDVTHGADDTITLRLRLN